MELQAHKQNAHLTHKANRDVGRHGWLRLTPAYSVRLVRDHVSHLPEGSVITDPFSGTGTTPLAAAEHGCIGQSTDINPFLIWLGNAKLRHFTASDITDGNNSLRAIGEYAEKLVHNKVDLWQPNLHNINRWWPGGTLEGLKALRHVLDSISATPTVMDALNLAFCRTIIGTSRAAFNHQSMSFSENMSEDALFSLDESKLAIGRFTTEAQYVLDSARVSLPGIGKVVRSDARDERPEIIDRCDLLLTSPPYANRMSYIRELRPYMYWMRFLDDAREAANLDWLAIGGTWGVATSRLKEWKPAEVALPIQDKLTEVRSLILRDGDKSGNILANYVMKYFHDMYRHFSVALDYLKDGGKAVYIVGNSTFYGHTVPTEQWYSLLMQAVGFEKVEVRAIRKRNSNIALYEYEVTGIRP